MIRLVGLGGDAVGRGVVYIMIAVKSRSETAIEGEDLSSRC